MKKLLFILASLLIVTGCSVESTSSYKPNKQVIYSDGLVIDGVTYEKTGEVLVIDKEVTIEGDSSNLSRYNNLSCFYDKTTTIKPFYIR